MEYIKIDGQRASRVCMGCWNIVGDATWGPQDEKESIETIKTALDNGINFFDTAEAYGNGYSEELLGKTLSGMREEVVIATKTARLLPDELTKRCEESLKRLKTDYIDIYYLHWPDWNIPLEETVGTVKKLEKAGKIKMCAVSNFGRHDINDVLKYYDIKINQVAYNLLFRAVEFEILPECTKKNVGIACYSSIAEGLLTGKFSSPEDVPEGRARTRHFSMSRAQTRHKEEGAETLTFNTIKAIREIADELSISMAEISLAWLLARKGVSFVIAGARKPSQIIQNSKAGSLKLPKDVISRLDKVTEKLKASLGPNPDMWKSVPRIR